MYQDLPSKLITNSSISVYLFGDEFILFHWLSEPARPNSLYRCLLLGFLLHWQAHEGVGSVQLALLN